MTTGVERAREELFAAHLLAGTNFAAPAIGIAHRAGLAAAEAALMALDRVPPAEPGALVGLFLRHVVRERGLDADAGRVLRALHNRALLASDGGSDVPQEEAARAIADATTVVDAVDAWLTSSEFVGIARAVLPRAGGVPPSRRRRR
jgi:uncharacterized protein (UPF0332 family)